MSDAKYAHAQAVWNKFHILTMAEYHELYLKSMHHSPIYTFILEATISVKLLKFETYWAGNIPLARAVSAS